MRTRRSQTQKHIASERELGEHYIFSILKKGLAAAIPFIMTGSIVLILNSFPLEAYQTWLEGAWDGHLRELFLTIYDGSLGILSLVLLLSMGYYYGRYKDQRRLGIYPILAVCSYVAFVGWQADEGPAVIFGHSWIFIAICVALLSGVFFRFLATRGRRLFKQYSAGADADFNVIIDCVVPAAIVIATFGAAHMLLTLALGDVSLNEAASLLFEALFANLGANLGSALLFVTFVDGLWFMGLHGSNMLDQVAFGTFESGMEINQVLVAAGEAPTEIFTKTFLDSFVMMGGCGTVLCLVIAVLIGAKMKNNRKLVKLGALPAIFNINEMILFGLPVIFNRYLLIPFILVPVVLTLTSGLATMAGWVPIAVNTVGWTTPPIFSGYVATGSYAGSILQAVNIAIGVLLYLPFIRMSERHQMKSLKKNIAGLTRLLMEHEEYGNTRSLINDSGPHASIARSLALDLRNAIANDELEMFYQVQVRYDNTIYGAEALLRWNHPTGGYIYPPLIIRLAQEDGFLDELDNWIFDQVCKDAQALGKKYEQPMEISVNMLPSQLENPDFYDNIKQIYEKYSYGNVKLALEMTEQVALVVTPMMQQTLDKIEALGMDLIMDDFGMGHSSMTYMQAHDLAAIKLDGKLVSDILKNQRSSDIVSSISSLTAKMGVKLFAEYVETEEQKERLAELGCFIYQGYLFSKPLPFEEFVEYLNGHGVR
ncbi:MAG: PTS sugar transporter subunit IIC/EAL domain-containing protein [Christensenellaceae bacterium]|jgi:lactose/cellobiose-specific phosphotransferase system IIC component